MRKEVEIAISISSALGLLAISLFAFTPRQRNSIAHERDEGKCLAPFKHDCKPEKIEVHHVLPQRYAKEVGLDDNNIDIPENAISVCSKAHDIIHPDRVAARQNYHRDKAIGENSFQKLGQERAGKLKNRQIYWNDDFDRQLRVVALKRTQEAIKRGWKFPPKKTKPEKKPNQEILMAAGD